MAKKATVIDSVDALATRIKEMRAAQAEFATFTQEQVDKIFYAAAMAANKARIPLAQMAVEETGMGIMEDKVIKNHFASEYIYNKYKDLKTCGVIEDDPAFGYKKIAEPLGIIAAARRETPSSSARTRAPRSAPSRPHASSVTPQRLPVAPRASSTGCPHPRLSSPAPS